MCEVIDTRRAFTIWELLTVIALIALLLFLLLPALDRLRSISPRMVCGTNLSALGKAMFIYASENNWKYPTPSKWCDLLLQYTDVTEKCFTCYEKDKERCTYALNPNCDINSPAHMVLLFESKGSWNQCGGPELLDLENHEGDGCMILFNDGQAKFVRTVELVDLKWKTESQDHLAQFILEGDVEAIRSSLDNNAGLANARLWQGWTLLHCAALIGDTGTVELLIEHNADVNVQSNDGQSPLHCAAACGYSHFEGLPAAYYKRTGKVGRNFRRYVGCAENGDYVELAELLITNGAAVDQRNKWGETPLHYASQNGFLEMAKLLISGGADACAQDQYGETPLIGAARSGNEPLCRLIVAQGAKVTTKSDLGSTPLHYARNETVAKYLIAEGADIEARGGYSSTPLGSAATRGRMDVVKLLVELDAGVDTRGYENETPLYQAAGGGGHLEVVTFLVDRGADVNARETMYGRTALHSAAFFNRREIVEFLISRGADVDARDNDGRTPLHVLVSDPVDAAPYYGPTEDAAALLIEAGTEINARDKKGKTALSLAVKNGHEKTAEWLRLHRRIK